MGVASSVVGKGPILFQEHGKLTADWSPIQTGENYSAALCSRPHERAIVTGSNVPNTRWFQLFSGLSTLDDASLLRHLARIQHYTPKQFECTLNMNYEIDFNKVITQLREDFNEKGQENLANDLKIKNIPGEESDNPKRLVTLIAAKFGVNVEERDMLA
ncbi:hypothetical protein K1T71_001148 [Dendrolimus kikuchii]|uniref:Uncharacterized protein n=1 Tax=Dendrolimus kikuchii TaxID=765133 RepID=A0ACC1DID1_9NEOP|nr:hypothetical protein K1T71_001148 [Dendrolimus kikuchii]